jgi:hypothetical protein
MWVSVQKVRSTGWPSSPGLDDGLLARGAGARGSEPALAPGLMLALAILLDHGDYDAGGSAHASTALLTIQASSRSLLMTSAS